MTHESTTSNAELRAQVQNLRERLAEAERGSADRRRAEDALQATQTHFRWLIEQMPAVLWATDAQLRFISSVGAGLAALGLSPNQVVGTSVIDFLGTDDPNYEPLALHYRALKGQSGTTTLTFRDRAYHAHVEPLTDHAGQVCGTVGVALDITERQRADEATRASQRSLATLLRNLPGMAYRGVIEARRGMTLVSEGAKPLTGYEASDLLVGGSAAYADLIHPADRPHAWSQLQTALREDRPYRLTYRLRTAAGKEKWIVEYGRGVRDDNGAYVALEGFITTITRRKRAEEAARRTRKRLDDLVHSIGGIVWEADPQTFSFTFVSRRAERLLGYPLDQWLHNPTFWPDHVHPDDRDQAINYCRRATAEMRDHDFEYRMIASDGRVVWLHDLVTVVAENGRPVKLWGVMIDITERKQAEAELRASQERFRAQYQALPVPTYTWQRAHDDFVLIDFNDAAREITRNRIREITGIRATVLYPCESPILADINACFESQGTVRRHMRYTFQTTGDEKDLDVTYVFLPPDLVMVHTEDVTERKRAEVRLKDHAGRLLGLSRRLLEVQEIERRHVAQELHDEIGQSLTGLGMTLKLCGQLPCEESRAKLEAAQKMVKDLTAQVRDLSLRLRPTMLDDLGLVPALLWQCERFTTQTQIRVDFTHENLDRRLQPREVETAAFRIVQEALTNVARHAAVSAAKVHVAVQDSRLHILVADEGAGFHPLARPANGASSGLSGMRERAVFLGGRFHVDSRPGGGTRLTAEIPVQALEERRRHAFDPVARR
jgi:PAS domain S-box-containing protein